MRYEARNGLQGNREWGQIQIQIQVQNKYTTIIPLAVSSLNTVN